MLDKIIPPDDPTKVTRWRWFIAIAVAALVLNGVAGRTGILGVGAYAYASDVKEQGQKIDRLLVLQVASSLRDLKKSQCVANGNKDFLDKLIEEYQQQHIELTTARYPLTPCERNETG